ncbi:MAG: copper amine oxidase N-terminal domain-containing protein [Candidatus Niameybacter stercoravium]|nr:copper amine oxidase N-terminal domain-containing protein [Candidatus Niameybacter stercoravium]
MKRVKKFLTTIVLVSVLGVQSVLGFQYNPIYKGDVCVNGIPILLYNKVYTMTKEINGRTYIELEAIADALGLEIGYEGPILWEGAEFAIVGEHIVKTNDLVNEKTVYIEGLDIFVEAINKKPKYDYTITLSNKDIDIELKTNSPIAKVNGAEQYLETSGGKGNSQIITRVDKDQSMVDKYGIGEFERYIYVPLRFIVEALGGILTNKDGILHIELENAPELYPRGYEMPLPEFDEVAGYQDFWADARVIKKAIGQDPDVPGAPCVLRKGMIGSQVEYTSIVSVHQHCDDPAFMISKPCRDVEIVVYEIPGSLYDGSGIPFVYSERAYIRRIFNYYLPTGGNKLYDICYRGLDGELNEKEIAEIQFGSIDESGKVTGPDLQYYIGSDGKKVTLVEGIIGGSECIRIFIDTPDNSVPFCTNNQ